MNTEANQAALRVARGTVSYDRTVSQAETYGASVTAAWARIDNEVGEIAVLPTQIVFALRYGLPMPAFGEVTAVERYFAITCRWQ